MKKTVWVFMATFFVLAVLACGGGGGDSGSPATLVTAPTVTAGTISNVTLLSATISGYVTSDGGATVNDRGVCYGLTANPTAVSGTCISANTTGTGFFSVTFDLPSSGLFYARLYADNSAGRSYGPTDVQISNQWLVDGNSKMIATDGIGSFFFLTEKYVSATAQNVYLTKFDSAGNLLWEVPATVANYNEGWGVGYLNGYVYVFYTEDFPAYIGKNLGIVSIKKFNATTGNLTVTFPVSNSADAIEMSVDAATNLIYVLYASGSEIVTAFNENGAIVGSTMDNLAVWGQFTRMLITPDYFYCVGYVGRIVQSNTYNRIIIVKYLKNLSSSPVVETFHDSDNSPYSDVPYGAAAYGNNLYVAGILNAVSALENPVILNGAVASDGSISSISVVGNNLPNYTNLTFDANGNFFAIDRTNNKLVKINPATGLVLGENYFDATSLPTKNSVVANGNIVYIPSGNKILLFNATTLTALN